MSRYGVAFAFASFLLVLGGCGGSTSSTLGANNSEGGIPLSQYQATLPDGSQMEIEILANDNRAWSGEFAVSAETGPYAFQTGSFEGTLNGPSAAATCEAADGTVFQLSGTVNGNSSLQLTRSDIPGVVLNFTPVTPMSPNRRADTSFNMATSGASSGSSGRVTISTTPYSVQGGGTMTEYRGTWLGLNVTFWSYSSGYASIIVYVNDFAISSINFASYRLSDFGTSSQSSSNARVTVYSPVTKSQVQFPNAAKVSP
ncbi:MAG: hypothetical protein P4L46_15185 [Fimbriimonas sp.]|nr:hypothetical protein [Fimbriimonas sp.]